MNNKPYIYIANWKMYQPFSQALLFAKTYAFALAKLAENPIIKTVVICPSFPALPHFAQAFSTTLVNIGAQNCASYNEGAYTGEVDASSLAQVGCTYCIVGHSERRIIFNETQVMVKEKVKRVIEEKMIPIICIGETYDEYRKNKTSIVLKDQLVSIIEALSEYPHAPYYLAYEPVWAIGGNATPSYSFLTEIFTFLRNHLPINSPIIYGGNVNPHTIIDLKKITLIDGFLIGKASLDFKSLQKIVL